ncbi:MAG: sigma-70 family RNA polymerase sigma factor [Rubrivivax sp.]|nr:sigma-70 family RNA polymerase sigma factor [Rubrivivax sp.]
MNQSHAAMPPVDLEAAYAQTRRSLLAYLRRLCGDAQLAEDLMHDVMLKALAALGDGREAPRNLSAWLHRVAHNAAMDHHRARRPEAPLDDDLAESIADPTPDADQQAERGAFEAIAQCLRPIAQRLPETYREVVRASEFEHRPLSDIADELGITVTAARQRASRGRRLLRDDLERCCRQLVAEAGLTPAADKDKPAREAGVPNAPRGCGCTSVSACR